MGIQIVLGTQVREEVDVLMKSLGVNVSRDGWVDQLSSMVLVHRSFSLLIIAFSYYLMRISRGLAGLHFRAGIIFIVFISKILNIHSAHTKSNGHCVPKICFKGRGFNDF